LHSTLPLRGPRLNIIIAFGKKTRVVLLFDGEKNFEDTLLFSTEYTNVPDTQTKGRTDGQPDIARWHRPRLYIASR